MTRHYILHKLVIGVAVCFMFLHCTDRRGVILKGHIVTTGTAPDNTELWLGLWTEDPTSNAADPLVTVARKDVVFSSSSETNSFDWRTEIAPIIGSKLYVGAFYETDSAGADGYPDKEAEVVLANDSPFVFDSNTFTNLGNGAYENKNAIVIDFTAGFTALKVMLETTLEDIAKNFNKTIPDLDAFTQHIHPFYDDVFANDYITYIDWVAGEITEYTLNDLPMYGIFREDQQEKIVSVKFSPVEELQIERTRVQKAWLQYTRKSDLWIEKIGFSAIDFEIIDGIAKITSVKPATIAMSKDNDTLLLKQSSDLYSEGHAFEVSWVAFGDYSEQATFEIVFSQWSATDTSWDAVTAPTEISRTTTNANLHTITLAPDCSEADPSHWCHTHNPKANALYRIRITPVSLKDERPYIDKPYSEIFFEAE